MLRMTAGEAGNVERGTLIKLLSIEVLALETERAPGYKIYSSLIERDHCARNLNSRRSNAEVIAGENDEQRD